MEGWMTRHNMMAEAIDQPDDLLAKLLVDTGDDVFDRLMDVLAEDEDDEEQ